MKRKGSRDSSGRVRKEQPAIEEDEGFQFFRGIAYSPLRPEAEDNSTSRHGFRPRLPEGFSDVRIEIHKEVRGKLAVCSPRHQDATAPPAHLLKNQQTVVGQRYVLLLRDGAAALLEQFAERQHGLWKQRHVRHTRLITSAKQAWGLIWGAIMRGFPVKGEEQVGSLFRRWIEKKPRSHTVPVVVPAGWPWRQSP